MRLTKWAEHAIVDIYKHIFQGFKNWPGKLGQALNKQSGGMKIEKQGYKHKIEQRPEQTILLEFIIITSRKDITTNSSN